MNLIANEPFFVSISAARKSGKTYFITKCLRSHFIKRFDHIFILCPSANLNTDYTQFRKYEKVHIIAKPTSSFIDDLFDRMSNVKEECVRNEILREDGHNLPKLRCPEALVILDDCIDSNLMQFRGCCDKLAERGRHPNISVIISSQRLSAISLSIRTNSDLFITFSPNQIRELEKFAEQYLQRDTRHALYECMRQIFDVKYNFLMFDNTETNIRKKLKMSNTDDFIHNKYQVLDLTCVSDALMTNNRRKRKETARDMFASGDGVKRKRIDNDTNVDYVNYDEDDVE